MLVRLGGLRRVAFTEEGRGRWQGRALRRVAPLALRQAQKNVVWPVDRQFGVHLVCQGLHGLTR